MAYGLTPTASSLSRARSPALGQDDFALDASNLGILDFCSIEVITNPNQKESGYLKYFDIYRRQTFYADGT
jgi:hypothetical protein